MSLLLNICQNVIAYLKHVRIVPVALRSLISRKIIYQEVPLQRLPLVLIRLVNFYVLSGPPRVCDSMPPLCDVLVSPIADRIEDFSACIVESLSHCIVSIEGRYSFVEAIVVFEVVDTPRGVVISINLFKPKSSRPFLASHCSC